MDVDQNFQRYQDLQTYVGWTSDDAVRVRELEPQARRHFAALVDDFYQEIDRHPAARQVIAGGESQIERLKQSLFGWLEQLFSGCYDTQYVARRRSVGTRHVSIGLDQVYANMALARLRGGLVKRLTADLNAKGIDPSPSLRSLNKLLDLDLAVIEDSYETEYRERLTRRERLAAIGQIAGGVAHELRTPLNVIKTSAYFLSNAKNATPEKQAEHLARIVRQVGVADDVISALADFARMPHPEVRPVPVVDCLREAIESTSVPSSIPVDYDLPNDLPPFKGDARQLGIVFRNLVRNAVEAMPEGGGLRFSARTDNGMVCVDVIDRGCGIRRHDLERIMEPLYSTKARGLGLGLAISRAIIEQHLGTLSVESEPGQGSTFTVRLPAATASEKPPI